MIDHINSAWGWIGFKAVEIVQTNKFGNVIFRDAVGRFWRICPEELTCNVIAETIDEYNQLIKDQEFLIDWFMETLVEKAEEKYGTQSDDRCFCLKIPSVLGGSYGIENIGTIQRHELISFSGDIAEQIKGFPDGSKVKLKFTN
jgi:hypothetical protein